MNAMNDELKLRGEKIGHFESENSEFRKKISDMQETIDNSNNKMSMQSTKIQSLQLKLETTATKAGSSERLPKVKATTKTVRRRKLVRPEHNQDSETRKDKEKKRKSLRIVTEHQK